MAKIDKIKVGSLVKLKISGPAQNTDGVRFKLKNDEIGLIVETDVWPDPTWKDRHKFQKSGPFIKVLFSENLAIIQSNSLQTEYFELILEK